MSGHIAPMVSKDWNTPKWILDEVRSFFGDIDLDPCSNAFSIVGAKRTIALPEDGLKAEWITDKCKKVFVNPPYGRDTERGTSIYHWVQKASLEAPLEQAQIIMLVPAATETKHWQELIWRYATAVCFINRRVKFLLDGQEKAGSTSGSALVYFGPYVKSFIAYFRHMGYCVHLRG